MALQTGPQEGLRERVTPAGGPAWRREAKPWNLPANSGPPALEEAGWVSGGGVLLPAGPRPSKPRAQWLVSRGFPDPYPHHPGRGLADYSLTCAAWGTRHQAGRSPGKDQVLLLCCPGLGGHRFRVALVTWLDGISGSRLPLPLGCSAPRQATGPLFLGLTLRLQTRGQCGRSLPPASRMLGLGRWHVDLWHPDDRRGVHKAGTRGRGMGQTFSCG